MVKVEKLRKILGPQVGKREKRKERVETHATGTDTRAHVYEDVSTHLTTKKKRRLV